MGNGYKVDRTIITPKQAEGRDMPNLRKGDIREIYYNLPGPVFSKKEIKNRKLKYKIFVGRGKEYVPERVTVPRTLLGKTVLIDREPEGDLMLWLENKTERTNELIKKYKKPFKMLIDVAEDYMRNLKNINFNYRKDLEYLKKKIDAGEVMNGERNNSTKIYVDTRRNKVSKVAEQLQTKLNKLKNSMKANKKIDPESKVAYEFLINYAHFLFYDPIIVGSGAVADLKVDETGVSEHQGLIDINGFNSLVYENVGLCNSLIIRFVDDEKLEEIINEGFDMELIDMEGPEKQRAYLLLSQEEFKKYERIPTPNVYICFEIPAAEK